MKRADGRGPEDLRKIDLLRSCQRLAAGSAMIRAGHTQILCAATIEGKSPPFLRGTGKGWVTAEYGMLPASVPERAARNKISGRSMEIQRLIGRSLRSVVRLELLRERTITIDCDVLDADGGTRTAAITAGYVALREAVDGLLSSGAIAEDPFIDSVAAVSVGRVDGVILLDLCHNEDSRAEVDLNLVATGRGQLIEVQGTAEHGSFSDHELSKMVRVGLEGISQIRLLQRRCLESEVQPDGAVWIAGGRPEERVAEDAGQTLQTSGTGIKAEPSAKARATSKAGPNTATITPTSGSPKSPGAARKGIGGTSSETSRRPSVGRS